MGDVETSFERIVGAISGAMGPGIVGLLRRGWEENGGRLPVPLQARHYRACSRHDDFCTSLWRKRDEPQTAMIRSLFAPELIQRGTRTVDLLIRDP